LIPAVAVRLVDGENACPSLYHCGFALAARLDGMLSFEAARHRAEYAMERSTRL
jgi:hypothetical protein